ncbi:MAG: hypothetical protein ACYS3N_15945 [Planctomycetota bacterium]
MAYHRPHTGIFVYFFASRTFINCPCFFTTDFLFDWSFAFGLFCAYLLGNRGLAFGLYRTYILGDRGLGFGLFRAYFLLGRSLGFGFFNRLWSLFIVFHGHVPFYLYI